MTIDEYIETLNDNMERRWMIDWIIPFDDAYTRAWDRFKQTIDNDRKAREERLKLLCTVLSIGMGGALAGLLAGKAMRTVVLDSAVDAICNRNMVRTFNAVARLNASPAARFIAKETWDEAAGYLSSQAEQAAIQRMSLDDAGISFDQNPRLVRNGMERTLLSMIEAADMTAKGIRDNPNLDDATKTRIATGLAQAPLFQQPRLRNAEAGGEVQQHIELAMYMPLVMSKDVRVSQELYWGRDEFGVRVQKVRTVRRQIDVRTNSPDYPERGVIDYDSVGYGIARRINALFRAREGRTFFHSNSFLFGGSMGHNEIVRAENTLERMNRRYSSAISSAPVGNQ